MAVDFIEMISEDDLKNLAGKAWREGKWVMEICPAEGPVRSRRMLSPDEVLEAIKMEDVDYSAQWIAVDPALSFYEMQGEILQTISFRLKQLDDMKRRLQKHGVEL